ncbi:MAG: type II toxin-antitoxin system VapC family toxin [Armatimonadetes bacterium]|nr:type II toxin-antitoxin system VapC family toxin [Armatimonadota bacterium]
MAFLKVKGSEVAVVLLLETTAFSDLMREHKQLIALLEKLSDEDIVVTCTIVRGEILYGIARLPEGWRKRKLEEKASKIFEAIPCLAVPEEAADYYAATKLAQQQKGLALDENDLWIASTALALKAVLLTRDTDFKQIEGLHVMDWTTEENSASEK